MGFRYGIDYLTQLHGKTEEEERLIADVILLIPNSGKTDVLIIDSKSSTKIGEDSSYFFKSIEASLETFAKKDYKKAVERKIKEEMPQIAINSVHLFVYFPFDNILPRISEERSDLIEKFRDRKVSIITPIILNFLLDSIKLYSSRLEINENAEKMMNDVKVLIERTSKVLEYIKSLGKDIRTVNKKYEQLHGSVVKNFVPIVNKIGVPFNIKRVVFDAVNDDELKMIPNKEEENA